MKTQLTRAMVQMYAELAEVLEEGTTEDLELSLETYPDGSGCVVKNDNIIVSYWLSPREILQSLQNTIEYYRGK